MPQWKDVYRYPRPGDGLDVPTKVLVKDEDSVQLDSCNRLTTASQIFRLYSGRQLQLTRVEGFRNPAIISLES